MKLFQKALWLTIATTIISVLPVFSKSMPASSVERVRASLESIRRDAAFNGASIGILAVTAGGDTIASSSHDRMFIPASNMKLITTAIALQKLGPDFRFETRIGYSGRICNGQLVGDLYIIGGGDPTTCSNSPIATPRNVLLDEWKGFVEAAGIREIDGYVIGDGRCFSGMMEHGSWQLNDTGIYYGSGVGGLSFNENIQTFKVSPGSRPGAPLDISPDFPDAPWMKFIYNCTTGKKGSGNSLYLYTSTFAPVGEMRGSYPVGARQNIERAANKFPEYTCAYYLAQNLASAGIKCSKGPADLGNAFRPKQKDWQPESQGKLKIIGSTFSTSLNEIIWMTLTESNNLYAESIMKALGAVYGDGNPNSAQEAVSNGMRKLGVDMRGLRLRDGSGLSRENLATPEFICRFLKAIMSARYFGDFVECLPKIGKEGTLKYMMESVPDAVKDRIRMKSGSMGGVRCYSGYVIPQSGKKKDTIIFSIMVNGFTAPTADIQTRLEELIATLAESN